MCVCLENEYASLLMLIAQHWHQVLLSISVAVLGSRRWACSILCRTVEVHVCVCGESCSVCFASIRYGWAPFPCRLRDNWALPARHLGAARAPFARRTFSVEAFRGRALDTGQALLERCSGAACEPLGTCRGTLRIRAKTRARGAIAHNSRAVVGTGRAGNHERNCIRWTVTALSKRPACWEDLWRLIAAGGRGKTAGQRVYRRTQRTQWRAKGPPRQRP